MEWDLDPTVAQQLREEAKKSTRIRVSNKNTNNNNDTAAASSRRPKPNEYCLVELQGELVYPTEENSLFGTLGAGAAKQERQYQQDSARKRKKQQQEEEEMNNNNNDNDNTNSNNAAAVPEEEEEKVTYYTVGKISEDDVNAARTKSMLKMGTLFVEGERMKVPGPTLVLIDQHNRQKKKQNTTNKSSDEEENIIISNGLPKNFNDIFFSYQHQASRTNRRQRDDDNYNNHENNEEEEGGYRNETEEELELMQELEMGEDYVRSKTANNNKKQKEEKEASSSSALRTISFAPDLSQWELGVSENSFDHEKISESQLLKCLNDHCVDEKMDSSGEAADVSYDVLGVLAQKYLFKSKPSRQTKA